MSLIDRSVRDLLAAFSSPDPTPGGGSASALAGAVGAALLVMVASLPKTRHTSDEDRSALAEAGAALATVRTELAHLVDQDTEAYNAVMAAYRLPKASEDEQRARAAGIQRALAGAIETPLHMMRVALRGLELAAIVARHATPSAASDTGVAVELLSAAIAGARTNVETNLGQVTRPDDYADRIRAEVADLARATAARAESVRALLRQEI